MKPRIAIVAALPRELAPLVRDWPAKNSSRQDGFMVAGSDRAVAICAGMGPKRARIAVERAMGRGPVSEIISVGFAGALRPQIARGSLYWVSAVFNATTGERFSCAGTGTATLLTVDHVAAAEEKPQFASRWQADLVDMEAAEVARAAQEHGIPFRALKVVSDAAGDVLPDFNRFVDEHGGFREGRFAAYLALHPWQIPTAIRMGRAAAAGAKAMAAALRNEMDRADETA